MCLPIFSTTFRNFFKTVISLPYWSSDRLKYVVTNIKRGISSSIAKFLRHSFDYFSNSFGYEDTLFLSALTYNTALCHGLCCSREEEMVSSYALKLPVNARWSNYSLFIHNAEIKSDYFTSSVIKALKTCIKSFLILITFFCNCWRWFSTMLPSV